MNPVPPRMRRRMGARTGSGVAAARSPGAVAPTSTDPPTAAEVFRKSRLLGICEAGRGGLSTPILPADPEARYSGLVDQTEVALPSPVGARGVERRCS
jgi:hypothetical protein